MENFDINAIGVCVYIHVADKNVTSVEWTVTNAFWHFMFADPTLRCHQTDSPSRTLVRLAYKSYQLGLPFSMSSLSITDGVLYSSHRKKVEEMEQKWSDYPFSDYKLKKKTTKSFIFTKVKSECQCGRKANLKCISKKCSKCCKLHPIICKVHS